MLSLAGDRRSPIEVPLSKKSRVGKDPRIKIDEGLKPYSTQDAIDLVIYNSCTPDYSATNENLRKFASTLSKTTLTRMASPISPNEKARKANQVLFYPGLKQKTAVKSLKTVQAAKQMSKTGMTAKVRKTFLDGSNLLHVGASLSSAINDNSKDRQSLQSLQDLQAAVKPSQMVANKLESTRAASVKKKDTDALDQWKTLEARLEASPIDALKKVRSVASLQRLV